MIFNENEKFEKCNMESIEALMQFSNVKNKHRYFQKNERSFA
jgi:hypothetical protein